MKVLVIPDIHMRWWMLSDASKILKSKDADAAVCLGDIVDDWGEQENIALYKKTINEAVKFEEEFPATFWCYGNHDLAYLWDLPVTGTAQNIKTKTTATEGLKKLYASIPSDKLAIVHKIDNVIFSHAGISRIFVKEQKGDAGYEQTDKVIANINRLGPEGLWYDDSPLWLRPQPEYCKYKIDMYKPKTFLQVVGHSPVTKVKQDGSIISCDTFSTYRNGIPVGNEDFCIVDTVKKEWKTVFSSKRGALKTWSILAENIKENSWEQK